MDARLDPGCEGANALVRRHKEQEILLVAGSEGQLASIVKTTQEQQIQAHLVSCARCRHYEPRCESCGFDVRRERHGWRCPKQASRWRDWLPWNWRPRHAPRMPAGAEWKQVTARVSTPRPDPARPRPTAHAPVSMAPPARAAPPPPKPRAKPQSPKPTALAVAYASLGLSTGASEPEVRKAYRERAQQYHPDKVAHMAPEFREVAERKMTEINAAYERIKRSWG